MKVTLVICLAALAAAAQDTQPPVISLDLTESQAKRYNKDTTHVGVGCKTVNGKHNSFCRSVSGTISDGYSYVERYSRTCEAGKADLTNCGLPNAHAYDHQDGPLKVTKTIR